MIFGRERPFRQRFKYYKTLKAKLFLIWKELRQKAWITLLRLIYARILMTRKNGSQICIQNELYLFKINDIIWFGSPGEPFSTYQKQLIQLVPEKKAFFNSMANDSSGYIFPWKFYAVGGYGPLSGMICCLGKNSLRFLKPNWPNCCNQPVKPKEFNDLR